MNKRNNIVASRIDDWSFSKLHEFINNCTDFDINVSETIQLLIEFADFCNRNSGEEMVSFTDFCNSRTNRV